MKILALLLLAIPILAQNALFIDLSGPWKMHQGDDPRYAAPAWDDRDWAAYALPQPDQRLPRINRGLIKAQGGFAWLRRTVNLGETAASQELILTLGLFTDSYEMFVNGARVAATRRFAPEGPNVPKSRSFLLPAGTWKPGANTIAIRASDDSGSSSLVRGLFSQPDDGPYVLADTLSAPRHVAEHSMDRRLRSITIRFLAGGLSCLLAIVVFLLWFGERQQLQLLYLGCFLLLGGAARLVEYLGTVMDWPFNLGVAFLWLQGIPLAYFALSVLNSRATWLPAIIWVTSLVASTEFLEEQGRAIWTVSIYLLLAWSLYRLGSLWMQKRRWSRDLLLPCGAVLLVFFFIQRSANYKVLMISIWAHPFWWNLYDIFVLVLSLPLITLLLRQLATDRQEKQRLDAELGAARAVQQLLFSQSVDHAGDYRVEAVYEPAQEVGGDFFWTRVEADGSLLVMAGDVSGKGLKAAMLVTLIIGALRREDETAPAAILTRLNRAIATELNGGFVTACCLRAETGGRITIANAGHLAPYRNGAEVEVEAGLPLGLTSDAAYEETAFDMASGGQLTLVSDGVVEAANAKDELFGFDRTAAISTQAAKAIVQAAKAWGQNDDITVVTIQRTQ